MTAAFSVLGVLISFFYFAFEKKENTVFDIIVNSLTAYLGSFVIVSSGLFLTNNFSLKKAVFFVFCFFALLFVIRGRTSRPIITLSFRKFLPPVIASLILIPFVIITPFGHFAMGQDEGVYQTEAIRFIRGYTSNEVDYIEYNKLPNSDTQEQFLAAISEPNVLGVYRTSDNNSLSEMYLGRTDALSEISGVFHGLHTFSALLALWGFFFGISNMNGINLLLLILTIFWTNRICCKLRLKPIFTYLTLLILALSPQIIWGTKSALTEIGLLLIWAVFICEIMEKSDKGILLSALTAGIYGFWHVSMYVFMPFYALLYIFMYFYSSNRTHLKALITVSSLYLLSFWYSLITGFHYTLMNYSPVYRFFINRDNIVPIASVCALLLIAISIILLRTAPAGRHKINSRAVAIAVRIITVISLLLVAYTGFKSSIFPNGWTHSTLLCLAILTGFVPLIASVLSILIRTEDWIKDSLKVPLLLTFLYSVIIYSTFIRTYTNYFYYYSRYLTMYILIIILCSAVAFSYIRSLYTVIAYALALITLLPNDIYLLNMNDSSRMDWESLSAIEQTLEAENCDVVFLQPILFSLYYYDFTSLGIDVYPIFENPEESRQIKSMYQHAVFIDSALDGVLESSYPLIYRTHVEATIDMPENTNNILGLPCEVTDLGYTLSIYRFE